MRKILILVIFIASTLCFGDAQSTPELFWKKLENYEFKILYPDYSKKEALEIEYYLRKYKQLNTSTYNISPGGFTLILRSQMATQNGFVSIAPSRSEWFASSALNATLGSMNWYEALAVHEYRHFVQFENLNTGVFKIAYYLFGDIGLGAAIAWTTHHWYFEGDAVWAETNFTDAGRGRSARFIAHAKSLIQNKNFPTLDELLAGDFRYKNPNHYVWGYFIIDKAVRDYGETIWDNITMEIPSRIYNPFAIYTAFKAVTGKDFNTFYSEMLKELEMKWPGEKSQKRQSNYRKVHSVEIDQGKIYSIISDLDSHTSLYENNTKIDEINIDPISSKVSIKDNLLVYSKVLENGRYKYKETSDLYIYDIENRSEIKITDGKRFFNPSWIDNERILVVEFDSINDWHLKILNRAGKELEKVLVNGRINEAVGDGDNIYYISQDSLGQKEIWHKNSTEDKKILGPTRNILYNLKLTKEGLVFEADATEDKVKNYLFKNNQFYKLENNDDFAFSPTLEGDTYVYFNQEQDGNRIKKVKLKKVLIKKEEIVNVYENNPKKAKDIVADQSIEEDYNEYDGLLAPHSWSFIGTRGYQIAGDFINTLGTYSQSVVVGKDNEDDTLFASTSMTYQKYFPKISFIADYNERNERIYSNSSNTYRWKEKLFGARLVLPYSKKYGFYNFDNSLSTSYFHVEINGLNNRAITSLNDDKAGIKEISYNLGLTKELTARAIYPRFGITSLLTYSDAQLKKRENSYLFAAKNTFYLPGFSKNDGFKLLYLYTKHKDGILSYRIRTGHLSDDNFRFSRENNYYFFPVTSRYIANYSFPILDTSLNLLGDWFHVNRIIGNVFSDRTIIENSSINKKGKIYSNGVDVSLSSLIMRKIPAYITLSYIKSSQTPDGEFVWSLGLNEAF